MIPSILAAQVRRGVEEFLLTTFPVTNPFFAGRLEAFLAQPGAVFRGPYLSIRLPFLPGDSGGRLFQEVVPEDFEPHRHQQQAWERLASPGARSTLIATGTGSGKTECFLYPILDHCLRHRGRKGIKAIIVYPMNALATDQGRRLAAAIHENRQLRDVAFDRSRHAALTENLARDVDVMSPHEGGRRSRREKDEHCQHSDEDPAWRRRLRILHCQSPEYG